MDDRARHLSVVLIFFGFGVAQLVVICFFFALMSPNLSPNLPEFKLLLVWPSLIFVLTSLIFVLKILVAGMAVGIVGLLPRGISYSWGRISAATAAGIFVYPAGFAVISFAVQALFFAAPPDAHPPPQSLTLGLFLALLLFGGIVWLVGVLAVTAVALAFTLALRCWPRRVFLWACALPPPPSLAMP
jgi:hypothetical protein